MRVQLQFKYTKGLHWPELIANDIVDLKESDISDYQRTVLVTCNPTGNLLTLDRINKTGNETIIENDTIIRDQTVELEKIWVDDILIDLDLILELSTFVNDFPADYIDYCNKNEIVSAPIESHWPVWYFNGSWKWSYDIPFWPWYSKQKKNKQSKYHSDKDRELYIGTNATEHRDLLTELKKLLANHV